MKRLKLQLNFRHKRACRGTFGKKGKNGRLQRQARKSREESRPGLRMGKKDLKGRTASRGVGQEKLPAVKGDDLPGNGKPQAEMGFIFPGTV